LTRCADTAITAAAWPAVISGSLAKTGSPDQVVVLRFAGGWPFVGHG
jgi:hypothetical protein